MSEWIRHGECNGCGFCCQAIAYVELSFPNLLDDPSFLAVRGINAQGIKRLHVIDPCPQLDTNNRCNIYDKRPQTCIDFPSEPDQLEDVPQCGYYFENITTGEILDYRQDSLTE